MSWVDVFAAVPDIETDLWSDIALLGMTLDKDDFLKSGYALDEEKFPKTPGVQSTPVSTRATTRAKKLVTPPSRSGKNVVSEEEEEEEEEEEQEEDEDTQDEGADLDTMFNPPAPATHTTPGSSSSSGLPPGGVGAYLPGTPSSAARPAKKRRKVDPMATFAASLAMVMEDAKEDRRLARIAQEQTMQRLEVLTEAFKAEQKLNREAQQVTRDLLQDLMTRNPVPAISAMQPPSTSQQLLLQNRPTGSTDSAVSAPRPGAGGRPPLPSGPPQSDPLPPPPPTEAPPVAPPPVETVEGEQSAPVATEGGHNLPAGEQEVVPPSGTDPVADPPAGCAP